MNRKTAIAEPSPKSLTPPNDVRHIASAITFASACVDPGATEMTMSKTFRTLISIVMKTTLSTGREQRHGDAPEDLPLGRAVGARRLEHVARDRREARRAITTIAKPAHTQM